MKHVLLFSFLVILTSCGSIQEVIKKQEEQKKERQNLQQYIYPQKLSELKALVLKGLENKRDLKKAPTILMNKSMSELKRDNEISETLHAEGFEYKDNYYIDKGLELTFADSIQVFTEPQAVGKKVKNALIKGTYHILEERKKKVVITDGPLSYELISATKGGTQLHVYRLKGLRRAPTRVGVDWWGLLGGNLPFLLEKGAISWEKSREDFGARDSYAELEIFYLIKDAHQE